MFLNKKNFKCDFCGKTYFFPSSLKQHICLVHEGQKINKKLHEHKTCDESFLTAAEAREHIQKYHILNTKKTENKALKVEKVKKF